MKLVNESQKEWLEKGGSAEALTFIDTVVNQLHTKAVSEGIVYKATEEEVVAEAVAEEVVADVVETEVPATEAVVTEVTETPVAETKSTDTHAVSQVDFAAILTETIFAAQKQYHETVIAPLVAEIKSLKAELTKTETKSSGLFSFDMSSLLPSAAVASRIQKEFGTTVVPEIKGEPVNAPAITKKEVVMPSDGNLLANFMA